MNKLLKIGISFVLFALLVAAAPMRTTQPELLQGINQVSSPILYGGSGVGKLRISSIINRTVTGRITFPNGVIFKLVGRKYNSEITGDLTQIAGKTVMDKTCSPVTLICTKFAPKTIHFMMNVHDSQFQGWVYLRGDYRPFCGGAGFIPKRCLLE